MMFDRAPLLGPALGDPPAALLTVIAMMKLVAALAVVVGAGAITNYMEKPVSKNVGPVAVIGAGYSGNAARTPVFSLSLLLPFSRI
jgi:hypothetical protein